MIKIYGIKVGKLSIKKKIMSEGSSKPLTRKINAQPEKDDKCC